jgi:hypothetical protein
MYECRFVASTPLESVPISDSLVPFVITKRNHRRSLNKAWKYSKPSPADGNGTHFYFSIAKSYYAWSSSTLLNQIKWC